MKKLSCLILAMLSTIFVVVAQNQITGTVIDEDGLGIVGATVMIEGATDGAVTDLDGRFSLRAAVGQTLQISYVSYETITHKVTSQTNYQFTMKSSAESLEEVVVVGYSTQKRNTITAAVATVSSDAIVSRPVTDVTSALQGNVAGFNFNTAATGGATGGELGTPIAFNIRGNGSINGGNPYVLIDGVEQSMQNVNPADIASVTVLKDASASAVYGARAAYGVVLITTKSGKKGKAKVSYNGTVGASSPIGLPNPMNSLEYALYVNQRNENTGVPILYNEAMIEKIKGFMSNPYSEEYPGIEAAEQGNWWGAQTAYANTNWYDFYYKKFSLQHSHNLNVSGGSDNSTYYVGMGYVFQDGLMNFVEDTYDKYNLNARLEIRAKDWLKFNINNNLTFARTRRPIQNQLILYTNVARASPLSVERYPIDSEYNLSGDIPNLMASKFATNQISDALTLSATITPLKGWDITADMKARFDIADNSYTLNKSKSVLPDGTVTENKNSLQGYSYPGMWWRNVKPGSYTRGSAYDYYISPNIISTYENSWGKHYFKALAGYQMELKYMSSMYAYKDGMLSGDIYSMANANGAVVIGEARTHWATMGVMSRLNYNYNDTYFVELSGRYDGSSRFAPNNRWGLFPSVSVGYDIAREEYFKDAELPISQLKVRASYGRLGNQNGAGLHDYLSTMPLTSTGSWIFSGVTPDMYASVPKMISPHITWEKVDNANLGIDITALDSRLTLTADIYQRTTKDMLGPAEAIPSIGGISAGSVSKVNNASLRNRGWELSVNWQDELQSGFKYGVGFNVFDYKAVVTQYNNPTGIIRNLHQTGAVDANHGYYVGMDVGEIWGYQADQLFQSNAEINQYVKDVDLSYFGTNDSWQCGDLKYLDTNGDGKVNPGDGTLGNRGDLKIIGNATPRYSFGVNFNAAYKGFEVTALLQGVGKRDFIATGSTYLFGGGNYFQNHLDYWSPTNPDAYLPRLTTFKSIEDQRNTGYNTSRYLLNAAYMRLKNLMVAYSFNDKVLAKTNLSKLRIYVSCDNLFTIDGLPEVFDPETINQINWMAGGSGASAPGLTSALLQNGNGMVYPLNRKYVLGLDISF